MDLRLNNFVIFGSRPVPVGIAGPHARQAMQSTHLHGFEVRCGLVEAKAPPVFAPETDQHADSVLIKIRAFSLNYRDKVLIIGLQNHPPHRYSSIGSDFVAEVVAVGRRVKQLQVGDRVVGNNHYEGRPFHGGTVRAGIPTNAASRRYRIIHSRKLVRVPATMPDDMAGGFAINAQTAFSILRRAGVSRDSHVLVLSARSNTALACLSALRNTGATLYTCTTSTGYEAHLKALGVHQVLPSSVLQDSTAKAALGEATGGFDVVIDPFFDLHLSQVIDLIKPYGAYYTCGFAQSIPTHGLNAQMPDVRTVMGQAILRNLSIHGNCLGTTTDLSIAVEAYQKGLFQPTVDAVFSEGEEAAFLDRTFNATDRFGKVVYRYAN